MNIKMFTDLQIKLFIDKIGKGTKSYFRFFFQNLIKTKMATSCSLVETN